MEPIPLFGNGIVGKSRVVTAQRRVNCYYEVREDGDKTSIAVYGTPGTVLYGTVNTALNKPLRAMYGNQSQLFAIAHDQFYSLAGDLSILYSSAIGTSSGHAEITKNGTQAFVVDGSRGYLYSGGVLTIVGGGFPNGARGITAVSGFLVACVPGSNQFFVSDFNDGATWDLLAFDYATQFNDNLVAPDNLSGNLILFSELHSEVWQNVGTSPQPFGVILSATSEYGLAAIASRAHVAESIVYLAQTRQGKVQFRRLQGYTSIKVSTPDLDYIINKFSTVSDAVALTYGADDHEFYQCTFPTEGRSFLFDLSNNIWCEVQTGTSTAPARHLAQLSTYYAGGQLVSDYQNGNIYRFDQDTYTDNGEPCAREIITRHINRGFNEFEVAELYFDFETGVGIAEGQGSDPQIMIACSHDNGRTYHPDRWFPVGAMGEYKIHVITDRWGAANDFTFKLRYTEPTKFVITGGAIKIIERQQ